MSKLLYKTIADERPQGKPNVYFSCHPDDLGKYFEENTIRILRIQDCAIWYESEPEADYDIEELEMNLSQMQLIVIPVTTKLLTSTCRSIQVELPLAKEKHIPVLPLMMEHGLDSVFSMHFGDLQYLDPNDTDETRRSFDESLVTYIKSILVSNELTEKIRSAFDAYIFLSYRKKDRRKAQDLMRMIHHSPLCRDIAIWYDEFLIPGEDFNQEIEKMLKNSDLFTLVVTPNLVNEVNYVMTTEYPEALTQRKPVLPVEMEKTDRCKLDEYYKDLPPCVPGVESEKFQETLLEKVRMMGVSANDDDAEHNYLIGLAYLDGVDVEIDFAQAEKLITGAANAGVPEAMLQLAVMYKTGKGVKRDYHESVKWRKKNVEYLRKAYETEPSADRADELINRLWSLGDAQYELSMLDEAEISYDEMRILAEQYIDYGEDKYVSYFAVSYDRLGNVSGAKGNTAAAQRYYEQSFAIREKLAEKTGTAESRIGLAIIFIKLGRIAEEKENLAESQGYYEKSLAICNELFAETGTIESRKGLAVSYERLGDIAEAKGSLEEAQKYYVKSLAIREELAEKIDTLASWRDLSVIYKRLGDAAMARRDLAAAQNYYVKALAICKELAEKAQTIESMMDLSGSYAGLGLIAMLKEDLSEAQMYYEKSFAIREELAEWTGTIESKKELSQSYGDFGDMAQIRGDLVTAQRYHEKSLAICEELAEKTGTVQAKRNLSISYERLGDIATEKGDLVTAQRYYERDLVISEELLEMTGSNESKRGLLFSYNRLGNTALMKNDLARAQEYYEKGYALSKELAENTDTIESWRDLLLSYNRLGVVSAMSGKLSTAQQYFERCALLSIRLAEKTGTIQDHRSLAQSFFTLGVFYKNSNINISKAKSLLSDVVGLGKYFNDEYISGLVEQAKRILADF